ncbi:MAG: hypothetical protein IT537_29965 [Hyphomicrobiales bacterium]|nr:hypothetical protein [Hyphomicrobiales bacterium]
MAAEYFARAIEAADERSRFALTAIAAKFLELASRQPTRDPEKSSRAVMPPPPHQGNEASGSTEE